ncbi:MAG: hypothetical protein ACRERE_12150 [Candidatus Entotheonellia bacterium]
MPVGTAFNQQFVIGHVVYGISQARAPYINSLPQHVAQSCRAIGYFLICDEFNNRTFGQVPVADFGVAQPPSSKAIIKANLAHHQQVAYLTATQKTALKEYFDALEGTKYSPLKAVKMNPAQVLAKGNASTEDLVFRRACKFGLQYIIDQMRSTVHFVLDVPAAYNVPGNRIDSLDVVLKGQHAGHVPITTSELRCCYRNRASWIPSGRLKFYFNLLEVDPPWVDQPMVWGIYEMHRTVKGVI